MATDSSEDPLRPEGNHWLPKARGAASPLGSLVRLLARQAACEAIAPRLDEARSELNPTVVGLSAEKIR
jgi:hypothetical protein